MKGEPIRTLFDCNIQFGAQVGAQTGFFENDGVHGGIIASRALQEDAPAASARSQFLCVNPSTA